MRQARNFILNLPNKGGPADRWQRSFFSKFIFYQRPVLCQSSSYICQRHLTTSLGTTRKMDKIKKYKAIEKITLGVALLFTSYLMVKSIIESDSHQLGFLHLYVISPYIIFYLFNKINNKTNSISKALASSITSVVLLLITLLVYIDALFIHTSSTSALIFLFLPIYLIFGSMITFALIRYVISKVANNQV